MNEEDLLFMSIDTMKIRIKNLEMEIRRLQSIINKAANCTVADDDDGYGSFGRSAMSRNLCSGVDED